MYAVSFSFQDVSDTATMSDDSEIKAVFHAGIAMGLQFLENSDAGLLLEMLAPGTMDDVLNKMDRLVRESEITVKQI